MNRPLPHCPRAVAIASTAPGTEGASIPRSGMVAKPRCLKTSGVAVCGAAPLPFSPIPVSLSNFGVLLVGLLLGSRAGFAAALLFLLEGSAGLPVFSNGSLGLFGPTGGYLMAYPVVAFLAGWIWEHSPKTFIRAIVAASAAELLLFAAGISWLVMVFHAPLRQAANWGFYPFLVAESAKIAAASGIATRFRKRIN